MNMKKIAVFCIAMLAMTASAFAQQDAKESKAATKWNVSLDFGGYTSFNRYEGVPGVGVAYRDDALLGDLTITYNATKNFEIGIATGCFGPTAPDGISVPVLGVLAYRWYCGIDGKWQPFVRLRGGYAFSVNGKANKAEIDLAPGVAYQFAPWFALRASLDVNSFLGQSDGSKAQFNFAPRIGVEFKF